MCECVGAISYSARIGRDRMWASTGCAYRGRKSGCSLDPENSNSGYVIVEKAVKVHEEVLRMAITADTVL
jgi:hypothetical protein